MTTISLAALTFESVNRLRRNSRALHLKSTEINFTRAPQPVVIIQVPASYDLCHDPSVEEVNGRYWCNGCEVVLGGNRIEVMED